MYNLLFLVSMQVVFVYVNSILSYLYVEMNKTKKRFYFYLAVSKKPMPSAPMTRSSTRGSTPSGRGSYHSLLPAVISFVSSQYLFLYQIKIAIRQVMRIKELISKRIT